MATLTSSSVVVNRTKSETRTAGTFFEKAVTVTLSTHGTISAGEEIPATAFGLSSVEEVTPLVKSTNDIIIPAGPTTDRAYILLKAAGTAAPAATSGVFSFVVKGY